jgi:hypothetical protein
MNPNPASERGGDRCSPTFHPDAAKALFLVEITARSMGKKQGPPGVWNVGRIWGYVGQLALVLKY